MTCSGRVREYIRAEHRRLLCGGMRRAQGVGATVEFTAEKWGMVTEKAVGVQRAHASGADAQNAFKEAFREHPAGIAIIAAATGEGPAGITASSVASVGLDPLALAFSVTTSGGSAGQILGATSYVVHLLSAENITVAKRFARSGADRFTPEQGWVTLDTGEPFLPAARVGLRCRSLTITPVGESSLVLAEVLEVIEGTPGDPVVYHDRTFTRLPSSSNEFTIA